MIDDLSTVEEIKTKADLQDAINRTGGRVSIVRVDGDAYTIRIVNYVLDTAGRRIRVPATGIYDGVEADKRPFQIDIQERTVIF